MDDHDFSYFIILNKKTHIHTQFDTLRSNSNKSKIKFLMEGKKKKKKKSDAMRVMI